MWFFKKNKPDILTIKIAEHPEKPWNDGKIYFKGIIKKQGNIYTLDRLEVSQER